MTITKGKLLDMSKFGQGMKIIETSLKMSGGLIGALLPKNSTKLYPPCIIGVATGLVSSLRGLKLLS
jgi:hypothetical protein